MLQESTAACCSLSLPCHYLATALPLPCHRLASALPLSSHCLATGLPPPATTCHCPATALPSPCHCPATALPLPCHCLSVATICQHLPLLISAYCCLELAQHLQGPATTHQCLLLPSSVAACHYCCMPHKHCKQHQHCARLGTSYGLVCGQTPQSVFATCTLYLGQRMQPSQSESTLS